MTKSEKVELVTNCHRFANLKHSSVLPCAFTEHGVAMLASVLKSDRAIKISIEIINAFIRLRRLLANQKTLAEKFNQLESRVNLHDQAIRKIIDSIQSMVMPPEKRPCRIGFLADRE